MPIPEFAYQICNSISEADIIENLEIKLEEDSQLSQDLLKSLQKAQILGEQKLQASLYKTLEWPQDIKEYLIYLKKYLKIIPSIPKEKFWQDQGYSKEVLDRLCHFHFLVSYVQEKAWFKNWMQKFVNQIGSFLDTAESMSQETFKILYENQKYNVKDSMIWDDKKKYFHANDASGWLTYNQFLARKLNNGVCNIKAPEDNRVITSPIYCTYKEQHFIRKDGTIPEITINNSHKYGDIKKLLGNSQYADDFKNGTCIHYQLNVNDYQRFHSVVDGKILESKIVQDSTRCSYIIMENGEFQISKPGDQSEKLDYELLQTRGIVIIDTKYSKFGNIGKVAMIPVGMSKEESVRLNCEKDRDIKKGDEFGFFQYGGNCMILLFQEDQGVKMYEEEKKYYLYGEQIGYVLDNYKQNQIQNVKMWNFKGFTP